MIFKVFLLLIFCCLAAAGCSSRANQERASVVNDTKVTALTADAAEAEVDAADEQVEPAADGSEIVTSRDEIGSVVETRTFAANTFLDKIVLKTLPDGSKVGWAHTPDGEKRPLTDSQIAIAHGIDGDEFAEMLGLKKPKEEKTQTSEEGLPPVVETASLSPETLPEPQADTPTETAPAKSVETEKRAAVRADALDQRVASLQNELSRLQLRSKKK